MGIGYLCFKGLMGFKSFVGLLDFMAFKVYELLDLWVNG